jgi:hypothetical protein
VESLKGYRLRQRIVVSVKNRHVHESDTVLKPKRHVAQTAGLESTQIFEHTLHQLLVAFRRVGPGSVLHNNHFGFCRQLRHG